MVSLRILDVGRQVAGFAEQHVPWDDMESVTA
jgi:hypothetical protein